MVLSILSFDTIFLYEYFVPSNNIITSFSYDNRNDRNNTQRRQDKLWARQFIFRCNWQLSKVNKKITWIYIWNYQILFEIFHILTYLSIEFQWVKLKAQTTEIFFRLLVLKVKIRQRKRVCDCTKEAWSLQLFRNLIKLLMIFFFINIYFIYYNLEWIIDTCK